MQGEDRLNLGSGRMSFAGRSAATLTTKDVEGVYA